MFECSLFGSIKDISHLNTHLLLLRYTRTEFKTKHSTYLYNKTKIILRGDEIIIRSRPDNNKERKCICRKISTTQIINDTFKSNTNNRNNNLNKLDITQINFDINRVGLKEIQSSHNTIKDVHNIFNSNYNDINNLTNLNHNNTNDGNNRIKDTNGAIKETSDTKILDLIFKKQNEEVLKIIQYKKDSVCIELTMKDDSYLVHVYVLSEGMLEGEEIVLQVQENLKNVIELMSPPISWFIN